MKNIVPVLIFGALPSIGVAGAPVDQIFRSENYGFRMVYPSGWKEKESKGPSVLTSREKDGVSVNVTVTLIPRGGDESEVLSSLTRERVELALSQEDPPNTLVSFARQLVDSVAAVVIMSTRNQTSDTNVRVQSVQYIVAKGDFMYVITGTTAEGRFSESLPEIERIVGSVRFER